MRAADRLFGLPTMLGLVTAMAADAADPPTWSGVLETGATQAAQARTDGDDLTVGEAWMESRLYWQPRLGVRLGLGAGGDVHRYDGAPRTATGDELMLRLPATVMFSEHWGFTSLSSWGNGTLREAQPHAGHHWQIEAGALYVRDSDHLIALTAVATSQQGRRPSFIPLISAFWRFDQDWSLTVVDEVDDQSRLTRRMSERWELSLLVDARFYDYSLTRGEDGSAVLDDERAIVGIEAGWRPLGDERLLVRPFIGAVVARRVAVLTSDGDDLATRWVRPAPAAGLNLRAGF